MPGRTPSFIVTGLFIIMFLLGFFYMSCSSKTTELRQTLDEYEERIRSLTLRNSDSEKVIESINTRNRELEDEKSDIQRQMNKKDSEINDLNIKLNEKTAEFQSLNSDKKIVDEQLREIIKLTDSLALKNSVIEKLVQDYNQQKQSDDQQIHDLKQQIINYKNQINESQKNQENSFIISNQRYQPLISFNETINNSSLLFQESLVKFNTISNIFANENNSISDHIISINNTQQIQLFDLNQGQNNSDVHQRLQRSLDTSIFNNKLSNDTDNNNKTQFDIENAQMTVNRTSISFLNETNIVNNQSQLLVDDTNYRIGNREQFHQVNEQNDEDKLDGN